MLNENVAWPVSYHSIGTHIFGCRQEPKCVDDSHIKDSEIRTYDQIELRSASMLHEWQRKDNWTQCIRTEYQQHDQWQYASTNVHATNILVMILLCN